jgi:exosortase/archaeosortase family protein
VTDQDADTASVPTDPPRRRAADRSGPRTFAGAGALSAAVLLLLGEGWYRGVEAALAGRAMSGLLGFPVMVSRPLRTVFFAFDGTGPAHMLGLQVTLGCSSDLLLAPVLLFTGVLLLFGQSSAPRVLLAASIAAAVVVLANTLRLVLIAVLVDWWGVETGFGWGHTLFGSVLTLAGMALALGVFVVAVGREHRGGARSA